MPRMLAWRRAGLGHACQSGNMAILLTSLLFMFKISFLPKYRVNYYDYSGKVVTFQVSRLLRREDVTSSTKNVILGLCHSYTAVIMIIL